MALKNTIKEVYELLAHITHDLEKSEKGNKAAAQRVRTSTIKLEKLAKVYRKESIAEDKKPKGKSTSKQKKSAKKVAAKKAPAKKTPAKKTAAKTAPAKTAPAKKKIPAKLPAKKQVKKASKSFWSL